MNILTLLFFCLVKFVNSGFIETQISRSSSCLGSISFHHYHTDEFITKITNTTLRVVLSSGRAKVKMKLQGNCCFYVFNKEKCRGEIRKPSYIDALRPTNKGGEISVVKMDSWGSGCGANQTTVKKICKEKRKKSPNMESSAELLVGHPPFKDNGTIDKMEQDKDNGIIDKMEQDMTDDLNLIIKERKPDLIEDLPFQTFNKTEKPELIMSKVSDLESINITKQEKQHVSNDQVKYIINKMEELELQKDEDIVYEIEEHKIQKDEVIMNEMEEREGQKDEDIVNEMEEQKIQKDEVMINEIEEREVQKDEDIVNEMEEQKIQKDEVMINEMKEKEVQKVKDVKAEKNTHTTKETDFLDEITKTEILDYSFMNELRPSSDNPIPSKNYEQDKLIIIDDNIDVEVNSGVVTIQTKINSTEETKTETTVLKSFKKEITTSDLHTETTEITTTDSMDLYTERTEKTTTDSMDIYTETTEITTIDSMVLYNETTEIAATDSMNFYIENTSTAMNIRKNTHAKPEIEERKNMTGTDGYYETIETYKNMTTLEGMDEEDSADKQSLSEKNNIRIQDMDSLAEEHKDLRTGMRIIPKEEITYKEIEDENTSTKIEEITSKEILDAKSEEPKLSTRDVSNVSTKILSPTMLKPYLKEALILEEEQNATSNRNDQNLNTSNPEISQTIFKTTTPVTNDVKMITNEMMNIENKDIIDIEIDRMETTSIKTEITEKLVKVETTREDKPTTKDLIAPTKEKTMEEKPTMIETTTKKEVGNVNSDYHIEPSTIISDKNQTAGINQNSSMIPKINEVINYRNTYTNTSYRKYTRIDENNTNPNVYIETDTEESIFEQLNSTQTSQDSSYDFLINKTRQTLENKLMTDGDNFIYTNNLEETVPGQKDSSSVNITDKIETVTNRFDRPQSYSSISGSRSFSSISGMQFLFAFFTLLIQSYYK